MIGDAKTTYSSYLDLPKTVERIYKFNPESKLIYILRNPISRAYSSYWWMIRLQEESLSFEEALLQEEHRINSIPDLKDAWSYKRKGLYFYFIEQYLKYFPKENLRVILSDDLKSCPIKICNDVFDFFNLKQFNVSELEEDQQNKSALPTNKFLQRFMNKPSRTRNLISKTLVHTLGTKNKRLI